MTEPQCATNHAAGSAANTLAHRPGRRCIASSECLRVCHEACAHLARFSDAAVRLLLASVLSYLLLRGLTCGGMQHYAYLQKPGLVGNVEFAS